MSYLTWLDFECPSCSSPPGEKCETRSGHTATSPHADRYWLAIDARRAAERAAAPSPSKGQEPDHD